MQKRSRDGWIHYIEAIKDRKVAEIGVSYAGTPVLAHELASET